MEHRGFKRIRKWTSHCMQPFDDAMEKPSSSKGPFMKGVEQKCLVVDVVPVVIVCWFFGGCCGYCDFCG